MYRRYNLYQRFNCPWGQLYIGFPGGSAGKESTCNTNELGLMPELGRSPGEGNNYPLQYSGLENSMDREARQATVHGVAKSQTQLSNYTFSFHFSCIGEGNGNPLQCSCLQNPRDWGAWRAAVYGVAQSRTRLKCLRIFHGGLSRWLAGL